MTQLQKVSVEIGISSRGTTLYGQQDSKRVSAEVCIKRLRVRCTKSAVQDCTD